MLINYRKSTTFAVLILFLVACSNKDTVKEYDKPALDWYKKIIKNVSTSNFDKADNYYISLRSEHMRSPLLPTATMILAQVHMEDEGYLMADYYLDEYLKKYASGDRIEYAKFLKIKAAYYFRKTAEYTEHVQTGTDRQTGSTQHRAHGFAGHALACAPLSVHPPRRRVYPPHDGRHGIRKIRLLHVRLRDPRHVHRPRIPPDFRTLRSRMRSRRT